MAGPAPVLTVAEPDETGLGDGPHPSGRRWRLIVGAVLIILVLMVALWRVSDDGPAPLSRADVHQAIRSGIEKAQDEERSAPPDATTAYRHILPSLVTVLASSVAGGDDSGSSLGAGVVINAGGAVLTALHVVESDDSGDDTIQVRFADGTKTGAQIEERHPENDIAVLAVDHLPEVVVPAVLGGNAQIGDTVFPVGNPLGLRDSLTAGVVSALDRSVRSETGRTLEHLIQFDAAVNPGNSGGPLLDRQGQVIGIVTALANPSQQPYFVGIGFAVPIATAGGAAGGPSK